MQIYCKVHHVYTQFCLANTHGQLAFWQCSFILTFLITARKRSLGQGNVFTGLSLSTGGGGLHLGSVCIQVYATRSSFRAVSLGFSH